MISNLTSAKNVDILVSNNQNVKKKDVVGDHWKKEANLHGVSSQLLNVRKFVFWFLEGQINLSVNTEYNLFGIYCQLYHIWK